MTARAVAARHRRQPHRRLPHDPGVPAGDARAPLRAHRRDLERRRGGRAARARSPTPPRRPASSGWCARSPARTQPAASPPTRSCPGLVGDRAGARDARGGPRAGARGAPERAPGASPRRSPPPSRSLPARRPRRSAARRSRSTAAPRSPSFRWAAREATRTRRAGALKGLPRFSAAPHQTPAGWVRGGGGSSTSQQCRGPPRSGSAHHSQYFKGEGTHADHETDLGGPRRRRASGACHRLGARTDRHIGRRRLQHQRGRRTAHDHQRRIGPDRSAASHAAEPEPTGQSITVYEHSAGHGLATVAA